MNNKRIISFLLAVGVVVSSISSVTFADVEEDVINAQAKYEEYQKNVDKMTEEIVKFNSEIQQCLGNIEDAESELSTLNLQIQNNELKIKGLEEQIKEREKIQLKVSGRKDGLVITPELKLDKKLFAESLTMVLKGQKVENVSVIQKRKQLSVGVIGDKIIFDFNPYNGPIKVYLNAK